MLENLQMFFTCISELLCLGENRIKKKVTGGKDSGIYYFNNMY